MGTSWEHVGTKSGQKAGTKVRESWERVFGQRLGTSWAKVGNKLGKCWENVEKRWEQVGKRLGQVGEPLQTGESLGQVGIAWKKSWETVANKLMLERLF